MNKNLVLNAVNFKADISIHNNKNISLIHKSVYSPKNDLNSNDT